MMLLKKGGAVFDIIMEIFAYIASFLIICIMLVMCYEVIMRYFFHKPPVWAVESTEFMLYLLAFAGAAWLLKLDGHVRVDIIMGRLGIESKSLLLAVTSILGLVICLVITWFGAITTIDHFQRGILIKQSLVFPKYTMLIFIPIGCFLLAIQFLRNAYNNIKIFKTEAPLNRHNTPGG